MQNKKKIAFFDFCETLANFQTADAFVDFVRNETNNKRMLKLEKIQKKVWKVIVLIDVILKHKYSLNKRIKLYQLKGLSFSEIDKLARAYYIKVVKQNLIQTVINEMQKLRNEGWEIVLVSGGYDVYLKYFAKDYGITKVISSKIGFRNTICTGLMEGPDCLNYNKVLLLNQQFDKNVISSKAYSDSVTDIPFLNWADEGVVVRKEERKKWSTSNNYKEILWQ